MKFKNNKKAKIGLLVFSIIFSLILLEVVSGFIFDHLPSSFNNGKRLVELYTKKTSSIPGSIKPHPYLLYQNTPNYIADSFKQHNSLGYRGKEFNLTKKNSSIRILVLGGSTTHMYPYIKNPNDTWCAQLEMMLKETLKSDVEVINAGLPYATTAELLAGYIFRHQYLNPDILIIHTGGNDVAPMFFDDYNPEYTHFRSQGNGYSPRRFESRLLSASNFLKLVYAIWLNSTQSVYHCQPSPFSSLDRTHVWKKIKSNKSEGFRRNLDTLIKIAKTNNAKVLLFGFLQAKEEFLTKNKGKDFKGLEKSLVVSLEKHYKIMKELADKHKINFVIPEQSLFEDSWFQDNCHLNEQGEKVKASILCNFLINAKDTYFTNKKKSIEER